MLNSGTDGSEIWLRQAAAGDSRAVEKLFALHRGRLKQMVELRMSPSLRGRVDSSDVLQDAMLEGARTLQSYLAEPKLPFYLWLRQIVAHRLIDIHRRHLGAAVRDARRELNLSPGNLLAAEASSMAVQFSCGNRGPLSVVLLDELRTQVQAALDLMEPIDREVLALRHFEQLSNAEVALVLGIDSSAASKRYTRALERMKSILGPETDAGP